MIRQQAATRHAKGRQVVVVTDSAADIPEHLLEQLEIHVVPVRVHFGNQSYLDKVTLSPEQFYAELASNPSHPKTSQPPPGDFRRIFEFLASHYESVVSINLTAKVSGTFGAAAAAAARVDAQRITVLDSHNASLGQGLMVIQAAEAALAGADSTGVLAIARAAQSQTRTYALLTQLDYAVRGGRVPRLVQRCAALLRFTPILTNRADGRIAVGGIILGRFQLRRRFARWVSRRMQHDKRYRIVVGHGDCAADGQALLEELRDLRPNVESIGLTTLGTALGVHGGPGLLVVAVQPRSVGQ